MEFLAWPVVVLILGIVSIFVFRQPLTRFLDRAEKIGKGGIQAVTGGQASGVEVKRLLQMNSSKPSIMLSLWSGRNSF